MVPVTEEEPPPIYLPDTLFLGINPMPAPIARGLAAMDNTNQASRLPAITISPSMEGPKTPTRKPASRIDARMPGGIENPPRGEPNSPPDAPRLLRTDPSNRTTAASTRDEEDPEYSREQPNESPSLRQLRRRLRAAHIDPRFMDRPIARPMGPRPAPPAAQRPKRHRHSEPAAGAAALAVAAGQGRVPAWGARAMFVADRARPGGPRPLVASPSVRGRRRAGDPFSSPPGPRRAGDAAQVQDAMVVDEDEDGGSESSTPKASRLNKRQALSSERDGEGV